MEERTKEQYQEVHRKVMAIIHKAEKLEVRYSGLIQEVDKQYERSARNLIHYLAFRSFKIDTLQRDLEELGLPDLQNIEGHVMHSLVQLLNLMSKLLDLPEEQSPEGIISVKKAAKIIRKHNKRLFGGKSRKRSTRIMVTLPARAARDTDYVSNLIKSGMNCARINCAHDDQDMWLSMIRNVQESKKKLNKKCTIAMDLAGPKLRTGSMAHGPKVIHLKPKRNDLGQVVQNAQIWIAPPDVHHPSESVAQATLPVGSQLFQKIKRDSILRFMDARGKRCAIRVDRKDKGGYWASCEKSVYLETGMPLVLHKIKQTGESVDRVGEILPKEQFITLFEGDRLRLHRDPLPGENATYDEAGKLIEVAHISCTLGTVFKDIKAGEPIFFDDGKIEGVIDCVGEGEVLVRIGQAKARGSKLKADKGINLPDTHMSTSGLTAKDKDDLPFVARHADAINFSFVNRPSDVEELHDILDTCQSTAGLILKIETQEAFKNLPSILLTAMRRQPVGVMIARGDLAIETGWKNFATIQQEIVRICGAAHIPDIWATQVLENLAKKGTPSRSEITDAALANQAECVMLNKGDYIHKAVRMLDKILRRMQRFQKKTSSILPQLPGADELVISHRSFDIR